MNSLKSKIQGRWSSQEMELKGSAGELRALARQLREATEGLLITLAELDAETIKPYTGALKQIAVQRKQDAYVRITRLGEILHLCGDKCYLEALADTIEFPDEMTPTPVGDYHVHVEYIPDHFFLAPESEPLIVVCERGPMHPGAKA